MAVAIDTPWAARNFIPEMQRELDCVRGDGRRFQIHRVSVFATILPHNSEIWRPLCSILCYPDDASNRPRLNALVAKPQALDWQADPDDELGDAAVLHHLKQQAETVPLLSSVFSQSDRGNVATTLTGSALSASINATTQGRPLSSFHRYSYRLSSVSLGIPIFGTGKASKGTNLTALLPYGIQDPTTLDLLYRRWNPSQLIVWAGPQRDNPLVFSQVQVDVVDLLSHRLPDSCPRKRRRTSFNQFLQVSHSPGVEDTSRGNPLPQGKRFNGVRHRPDRNAWVAEMKPPKHKTKQDFGNFRSEVEAARAVDAAFHHYGRPDLLNFPDTSLRFLSKTPTAPAGLDKKAKVKFVKEEAKLLLAAIAASSPLRSTHTNSLQILERSASRRRSPLGPFRSLPEISSPFRCSGPDEVDDAISRPQPLMLQYSICDTCTTEVVTDLETLDSVQNAEQGWDWAKDSCTLAAPTNVVNSSDYESQSLWLDSLIRLSPAPSYQRSPSPSHFQDKIAYALLDSQSI